MSRLPRRAGRRCGVRPGKRREGAGPGRRRRSGRCAGLTRHTGRRSALLAVLVSFFIVVPAGLATAAPWDWLTNPNSICSPSDPVPEVAGSGLSGLVDPPGAQLPVTPYNNYEMAGLSWHATDLGCSDYLAIVGNYAANFVFMIAKAIDRVTITAYQTAYSPGLLDSLSSAVTGLVTSLKNTFYLPYITPVVLLGVIWLAWHGLVRRRATTSVEGVVWMIIAVTLALWFLNRPGDILRAGNGVVTGANCAITKGVASVDPNTSGQCFAEDGRGPSAVAQTANSLWTVLVYRPWLAGEFGQGSAGSADSSGETAGVSATLARKYGGFGEGSLLWSQAVTHKDSRQIQRGGEYNAEAAGAVITQKRERWAAIRTDIRENYPSAYPLFQGRQWGTRLGIAFAAFIAAIFAGGLILLVSVALIVLKLGFLLLLMTGPFFLLAGIHPGIGRVIALRWGELLVSTLLKQIVVTLALAVLLFGYSVITTESTLSWGLQILLLSLLGIAAFIYRKPFQHLFASVGGGLGGRVLREGAGTNPELADAHRRLATAPAGPSTVRRIGGRLATTALGGAVAGAVGGKAGGSASRGAAAAAGASGTGQRDERTAPAGASPAPDGTSPAAGEGAGPADAEGSPDNARPSERKPTGLRSGPRAGTLPPPLDLASRGRATPDRGAPTETGEPTSGADAPRWTPSGAAGRSHAAGEPGRPASSGPDGGAQPQRSPWPGSNGHRAAPARPDPVHNEPGHGSSQRSPGSAPPQRSPGSAPPQRSPGSAPPLPFWLRSKRGGDGEGRSERGDEHGE